MPYITDPSRQAWGDGAVNWSSDSIRPMLVQTTGTGSDAPATTDTTLADITSSARVTDPAATSALASKTNVSGVFDAADFTFTAVTGAAVGAVVLLQWNTGTPSASRVLIVIDSGTGLPVTPNGGDITLQWSNGANKIGKL